MLIIIKMKNNVNLNSIFQYPQDIENLNPIPQYPNYSWIIKFSQKDS